MTHVTAALVALLACAAVLHPVAAHAADADRPCAHQQDVLDAYLTAAFLHGDVAAAMNCTVNDASFRFSWVSTTPKLEALGFKHTLMGTSALGTFFGAVFQQVANFTFAAIPDASAPQSPIPLLETLATRCTPGAPAIVVKRWYENSDVINPGASASGHVRGAENTVVYTFDSTGDKILSADVFVATPKYLEAFGEDTPSPAAAARAARTSEESIRARSLRGSESEPDATRSAATRTAAPSATGTHSATGPIDCPDAQAVLDDYLFAAFAKGNVSEAMRYTVNDESFVFQWASTTPRLQALGFAPRLTGTSALGVFFGAVFQDVTDFGFGDIPDAGAPQSPIPKLETVATRCTGEGPPVVVKRWFENSKSIVPSPPAGPDATGRVGMATNLAVYTFTSDAKRVQSVDVLVDTEAYLDAFGFDQ